MYGVLAFLDDGGSFLLVEVAVGVFATAWSAWAVWRARVGRPMSTFAATAPFLAMALAGIAGGVAGRAWLTQLLPTLPADQRAAVFAKVHGESLNGAAAAFVLATPAAMVLTLGLPRRRSGARAGVATAAASVAFVCVVPWIAGACVRMAEGAMLLRTVVYAVAGAGLLRQARAGDGAGLRSAAVAFAVLVGLGELSAVAIAQVEGFHCGLHTPESRVARLQRKARDTELLVALALLTAAVACLPARRAGVRAALLAPCAVVVFTASADPTPHYRRFVAGYRDVEVPGVGVGPWGGLEVGACLPAPLASAAQPACPSGAGAAPADQFRTSTQNRDKIDEVVSIPTLEGG
ncbi:MAG: hypothetical protein ACOZNI_06650 [Myxococcota bacterium]